MQVLEKPWEMWENRDIKLVTTERRMNYLLSDYLLSYNRVFTENPLAIEIKKI